MDVSTLKDGKIIKFETDATPCPKATFTKNHIMMAAVTGFVFGVYDAGLVADLLEALAAEG